MICSSKSACFLYALFVQLVGKFHIKSTHGRLCSKWALPDVTCAGLSQSSIEKYNEITAALNAQIENRIRMAVQSRMPRGADPAESIFHFTQKWTETPRTLASFDPDIERGLSEERPEQHVSKTPSKACANGLETGIPETPRACHPCNERQHADIECTAAIGITTHCWPIPISATFKRPATSSRGDSEHDRGKQVFRCLKVDHFEDFLIIGLEVAYLNRPKTHSIGTVEWVASE